MTSVWKKAAIGLAVTAATVLGLAAPAYAAPRQFTGVGGDTHLTAAMSQAEHRAFARAADAGARGCELTQEITDDSDPYFYVVFATVTCTD